MSPAILVLQASQSAPRGGVDTATSPFFRAVQAMWVFGGDCLDRWCGPLQIWRGRPKIWRGTSTSDGFRRFHVWTYVSRDVVNDVTLFQKTSLWTSFCNEGLFSNIRWCKVVCFQWHCHVYENISSDMLVNGGFGIAKFINIVQDVHFDIRDNGCWTTLWHCWRHQQWHVMERGLTSIIAKFLNIAHDVHLDMRDNGCKGRHCCSECHEWHGYKSQIVTPSSKESYIHLSLKSVYLPPMSKETRSIQIRRT